MSADEAARRDNWQELFERHMLNRDELAAELAQPSEPQPEEDSRRELIEETVLGASEKTRMVLLALARRPGDWLTVEEIAASIPMLDGRDLGAWSVGGVLGALAGKAKRRGVRHVLFDVRYDDRARRYRYRMDEPAAAVVTEVVGQARRMN